MIVEGMICHPDVLNRVRETPNIRIYKNGVVIIDKHTDSSDFVDMHNVECYDLYALDDSLQIANIVAHWEITRKIYLINTEPLPALPCTYSIAGLASGTALASMAYQCNATDITFFDYSQDSLDFQKDLIFAIDRTQVVKKYFDKLVTGNENATHDDIDAIDFIKINSIYDNLRDKSVKFLLIDLRNIDHVKKLLDILPCNSVLWISNVYYYITSINHYNYHLYQIFDEICNSKNIMLLPHTRIIYEGSSYL
jgi:hypothetical protein